MASSLKKKIVGGPFRKVDMALICTEVGLTQLIPIERIMEAIEGPHSAWMMQERPIDYSIR